MSQHLISKISIIFVALLSLVLLPVNVMAEGDLVLFVEEGCPYCAKVKEFITEKNLEGIEILDIRENAENASFYTQVCDDAGISIYDRSIPLLYDNGEIISAADKIINYLGEKYGVSTEGYELVSDNSDNGNNDESLKVVFFILGAGVLASGAFIFLSKKSEK